MKKMTTWRKKISISMALRGEKWDDIISCTLTEEELDIDFDDDYGHPNGRPFTLWTSNRVYFPACYDGSEWVTSVSRNPDGAPTVHVGG